MDQSEARENRRIRNKGDKMKTLHLYKIYTPRDIVIFILKKEEDIIALLEKNRKSGLLGRKIFGFWYIRGSDIIKIQKLMKEKHGKDSSVQGKS